MKYIECPVGDKRYRENYSSEGGYSVVIILVDLGREGCTKKVKPQQRFQAGEPSRLLVARFSSRGNNQQGTTLIGEHGWHI